MTVILQQEKFYLDFRLHILNGVAGLDLQCDGLPGQRLDKDLHDDRLNFWKPWWVNKKPWHVGHDSKVITEKITSRHL